MKRYIDIKYGNYFAYDLEVIDETDLYIRAVGIYNDLYLIYKFTNAIFINGKFSGHAVMI